MRFFAVALLSLFSLNAFAGQPVDGALGLQPAATPIMEKATFFHDIVLLPIITIIVIFVMALLLWVIFRYNAKANPVPSKFSHNTTIEIVWTLVPVLILLGIAFFSFRLLYMEDVLPDAPESEWVTVKAQGNQWNWTYSYPDVDVDGYPLEFVSNPLHVGLPDDPEATPEAPRNLAVDYPMVVPADTYVRVQTAASDVIHSFAVPAFGVKTDAVPGKLNELWFKVAQPGVYYGQCSELCGKDHAFMPIEIRVVPREQYDAWIGYARDDMDEAKQYLASLSGKSDVQLASAR